MAAFNFDSPKFATNNYYMKYILLFCIGTFSFLASRCNSHFKAYATEPVSDSLQPVLKDSALAYLFSSKVSLIVVIFDFVSMYTNILLLIIFVNKNKNYFKSNILNISSADSTIETYFSHNSRFSFCLGVNAFRFPGPLISIA